MDARDREAISKRPDYADVSGKVGRDGEYAEIAWRIHREEYDRALELAESLGLRLDARSVGDRYQLAWAI